LWDTYVTQRQLEDPTWQPTWEDLKVKMLNALGTEEERKQAAYDAIKNCKQKQSQLPTDLLNYLHPLWVEIGETAPYRMVAEFTGALLEDIRHELRHLPQQSRTTLPQVEQEANRIYRDLQAEGKLKKKSEKDKRPPSSPTEKSVLPTTAKKQRRAQGGPKGPRKDDKGEKPPKSNLVCYACGKPGHTVPKCLNQAKRDAYYADKGKGKGQKD
jgi:hypothetical protein